MIDITVLRAVMPYARAAADRYVDVLADACREFRIDNPRRQAAFLAQVAHESGELRHVRELATGIAYEGRADLGNTQPGDGVRYKGRGLIQITGRANYRACGEALGADLVAQPEQLEGAVMAARSAAWFWAEFKRLNDLADADKFGTITKRINGGYTGIDARLIYWLRARAALGL